MFHKAFVFNSDVSTWNVNKVSSTRSSTFIFSLSLSLLTSFSLSSLLSLSSLSITFINIRNTSFFDERKDQNSYFVVCTCHFFTFYFERSYLFTFSFLILLVSFFFFLLLFLLFPFPPFFFFIKCSMKRLHSTGTLANGIPQII